MRLSSVFLPQSLLLISDNKEFEDFLLKSYKGFVSTPEEKTAKKCDLLVLDTSEKNLTSLLKKYGKLVKSVLITRKISEKNLKKLERWSKRTKKPVLNAKIFVPLSINTLSREISCKKGNLVIFTDNKDSSEMWFDLLSSEGIGLHSFIQLESRLGFEETVKYLSKSDEVKLFLFHFSDPRNSKAVEEFKLKKKNVCVGEVARTVEDVLVFLKLFSSLELEKVKSLLVVTNGYKLFDLPEEKLEASLEKKLKKFVKGRKISNVLDVGKNATIETVKKIIEISKNKIDLFLLVLNPYMEAIDEGVVYGLAVLQTHGVPILVYIPGGKKAEEMKKRLMEFSIPAFNKWFEVQKALKLLEVKV